MIHNDSLSLRKHNDILWSLSFSTFNSTVNFYTCKVLLFDFFNCFLLYSCLYDPTFIIPLIDEDRRNERRHLLMHIGASIFRHSCYKPLR